MHKKPTVVLFYFTNFNLSKLTFFIHYSILNLDYFCLIRKVRLYNNCPSGRLTTLMYCENCGKSSAVCCPKNVITAIRFICLTDPKKIFSFSLSAENLELLSKISEQYVLSRIQKRLPTLEFYKSVKL